jgi:hypothetical protein
MSTLCPYERNVVFPASRLTPDGRTSVIRSFGGAVSITLSIPVLANTNARSSTDG